MTETSAAISTAPTPESVATLRTRLHDILEHGRGPLGRTVTIVTALLVIFSVASLPFELMSSFAHWHDTILLLEYITLGIFTAEYLLRIYAAPSRLGYIFSWHGLINLIAIVPAYLHIFDSRVFRVLQMARLARLLKLAEIEAIRYDRGAVKSRYNRIITLLPEERIEHVAQKHPIFFILNLIPVIAPVTLGFGVYALIPHTWTLSFLAAMLLFAFAFFVKAWLDYAYDVMLVTNLRVILYNQHFFGSTRHELHFGDLDDITASHPSIFAYFLGYGTLSIRTASNTEIDMHHIIDHNATADQINLKKTAADHAKQPTA